jgi:hypothetical protein
MKIWLMLSFLVALFGCATKAPAPQASPSAPSTFELALPPEELLSQPLDPEKIPPRELNLLSEDQRFTLHIHWPKQISQMDNPPAAWGLDSAPFVPARLVSQAATPDALKDLFESQMRDFFEERVHLADSTAAPQTLKLIAGPLLVYAIDLTQNARSEYLATQTFFTENSGPYSFSTCVLDENKELQHCQLPGLPPEFPLGLRHQWAGGFTELDAHPGLEWLVSEAFYWGEELPLRQSSITSLKGTQFQAGERIKFIPDDLGLLQNLQVKREGKSSPLILATARYPLLRDENQNCISAIYLGLENPAPEGIEFEWKSMADLQSELAYMIEESCNNTMPPVPQAPAQPLEPR